MTNWQLTSVGYRSKNFIVGLTNSRPGPNAHALWNYTLCAQYPGVVPDGATVTVECTDVYNYRRRFRYVIVQFPLINGQMNFCEIEVVALGMMLHIVITFLPCVTINASACRRLSTYRPLHLDRPITTDRPMY